MIAALPCPSAFRDDILEIGVRIDSSAVMHALLSARYIRLPPQGALIWPSSPLEVRARGLLCESLARGIDIAERDVFDFGGAHCDRIVAAVNERLDERASQSP